MNGTELVSKSLMKVRPHATNLSFHRSPTVGGPQPLKDLRRLCLARLKRRAAALARAALPHDLGEAHGGARGHVDV